MAESAPAALNMSIEELVEQGQRRTQRVKAGPEPGVGNNNKREFPGVVGAPGEKRVKRFNKGRQWDLGDLLSLLVRLLWCLPGDLFKMVLAFCPHSLGVVPMKGQWSLGPRLPGVHWDYKITPTLSPPLHKGSWVKIEAFLRYIEYYQKCRQFYVLDTLWNQENSGVARDLANIHYYIREGDEELIGDAMQRCMNVFRDFWVHALGPMCFVERSLWDPTVD
jgi:hypothetical protein